MEERARRAFEGMEAEQNRRAKELAANCASLDPSICKLQRPEMELLERLRAERERWRAELEGRHAK
jgi:hypothetical protein